MALDYRLFRKLFFVGVLSLIILWYSTQTASAQDCIEEWANEISVFVDGKPVKSDAPTILIHCYGPGGLDKGQHVLLPVRAICEALGGGVQYASDTGSIKVTCGSVQISLTTASRIATVNGKTTVMKVAPLNKNGRVLVQVDFLCQMLGATINCDDAKQCLYINTSSSSASGRIEPDNEKLAEQSPEAVDFESDGSKTKVKSVFTEMPSHMRVNMDGYALPAEFVVIPMLQFDDNRGYYAEYNMVSMKELMEAMGATVSSNQARNLFSVIKNNTKIDLVPYSEKAYLNGLPVQLDVYLMLSEGKPMIAVEYACQVLGAALDWDASHLQAFVVNDSNLVEAVLRQPSSWHIAPYILNDPGKYKVQILYTEIIRQPDGMVIFVPHKYRVDANDYFYPASSIKLAAVLAATDKANNVGANIWCKFMGEEYGAGTLAQYISKILTYSDNSSFNILYDFLGHKEFNQSLWAHGYDSVHVFHRLEVVSNGLAAQGYQLKYNGKTVFSEPHRTSNLSFTNASMNNLWVGGSKSFVKNNNISIEDLQNLLKEVFFPETLPVKQGFNLTPGDRKFIKQEMLGSGSGKYKWFLCGGSGQMPKGIRIYNKIGNAWGFLVDNAYIVDDAGNEFLLTATIYCDINRQAYSSVGMPFMRSLGYLFWDITKSRNEARSSNK